MKAEHNARYRHCISSFNRGALLLGPAILSCFLLASSAQAQRFRVPGNSGRNWVNTGLDLPAGTLVRMAASGEVDVGAGWGRYGPEGTTRFANVAGYPAETQYRYGLVARLTASRTDPNDELREEWAYGERHDYCAARGGHLWLTVNDDDPGNNTGEFTVDLTRASCAAEPTRISSPVEVYTAMDRTFVRSREFALGEPVILRVENKTPDSLYYRANPFGGEIYRGEDLSVHRFDGRNWVSAVSRAFIDEWPIRCIPLMARMNTTRTWNPRSPVPGTYRLELKYNRNLAGCDVDNRRRGDVLIVYSEPFEVVGR